MRCCKIVRWRERPSQGRKGTSTMAEHQRVGVAPYMCDPELGSGEISSST